MGNNGPILTDLWQLDPATLTWTRMTNIPRGRYGNRYYGNWSSCLYFNWFATRLGGNMPMYGNMKCLTITSGQPAKLPGYIKVTQTGDYSVRVSNDEGCSATTPAVHITVQPKTVISTPPQNVTICDASPTALFGKRFRHKHNLPMAIEWQQYQ